MLFKNVYSAPLNLLYPLLLEFQNQI